MVRISIDLEKEVFLMLNHEEGRRKVEKLPNSKKAQIISEALKAHLEAGGGTGGIHV